MRLSPLLSIPAYTVLAVVVSFVFVDTAHADQASDIQAKIDSRASDIQALEKEIKGYQDQIAALGGQASSLSSTIKSLDLTQKKLQADINLTQDKIDSTNLRIQQLAADIGTTQGTIDDDRRFVRASFKAMNESGNADSLPEILLSSRTVSEAWGEVNHLGILQSDLQGRIESLGKSKDRLESNRKASEKAETDLLALQKQIRGQRSAVLSAQSEKNTLLKQTKSSESAYKQLLSQKQALRDAFQSEILDYESQLKLAVNLANLPQSGSAPLSWPLDQLRITQYFGDTPFATANPQIYNGHGHDGVDFAASIGTPIHAALSGVVAGYADTDIIPGCYSFGRWIMIRHANGLSTLYAHLSAPSVAVGESVATGQIIGYSGNTGYTTGPHLHFGVYATEGTEIKLFTNSRHCQGATVPLAVLSAYLNPLSYLPALPR